MDDELHLQLTDTKSKSEKPKEKEVLNAIRHRQEIQYQQSLTEKKTNLMSMELRDMTPVLAEKKVSADFEDYGESYKPLDMSANKRERKRKNVKSRLYAKDQAAAAIQKAEKPYEFNAEWFRNFYGIDNEVKSDSEARALSVFYDKFSFKLEEELISDYADEKTRPRALLNIIQSYLSIDINGIKLDSDKDVGDSAERMEDLVLEHKAMTDMMFANREFYEGLDSKIKDDILKKMNQISDLCAFYRVRKAIITDPYYRSHYNSEISRNYNVADSPEQKRLTRLILIANNMRIKGTYISAEHKNMNRAYVDVRAQGEPAANNFEAVKGAFQEMVGNEFNKLSHDTSTGGENADFLHSITTAGLSQEAPKTQEEELNKKRFDTLCATKMKIGDVEAAEPLFRAMSGIASIKGIKTMPQQSLSKLIDGLSSEDEKEKLANMEVLRELLLEHVEYLIDKYGGDVDCIHPSRMVAMKDDIQDDFRNTTCTTEALKLMLKIPALREGKAFDRIKRCLAFNINLNLYVFSAISGLTTEALAPGTPTLNNANRVYAQSATLSLLGGLRNLESTLGIDARLDYMLRTDLGTSGWSDPL